MSPNKQKKPVVKRQLEAIPSLFNICTAMGSTLELDKLLKLILRLTMKELRGQQGSILLLDRDTDQLKMLATRSMPREITRRGYIPRKGSIAEWVIENNKPLLLDNVRRDERFTSIAKGRPIRSSMCVPLCAKGSVIGTINITRTIREKFTDSDLNAVAILATQAAVSIDNARLYDENIAAERLAAIGRTVAAISHCTKNMLTGLKGGAAIVQMGCQQRDWDLVDQGQQMVKRNTDRVAQMVLNMLDYSKERAPMRTVFDLGRLVEEVLSGIAYSADQAGVRLLCGVKTGRVSLFADYNQLYRALLNLVTNALDAIREDGSGGGEVEVTAERVSAGSPLVRQCLPEARGRFDLIHVRDTGTGIARDQLANLFQPFYSSKGSRGTGLGLAVTRKIAREHGGEIALESEVGRGTVFTIVLAVVKPPADPEGKEKATKTRQG